MRDLALCLNFLDICQIALLAFRLFIPGQTCPPKMLRWNRRLSRLCLLLGCTVLPSSLQREPGITDSSARKQSFPASLITRLTLRQAVCLPSADAPIPVGKDRQVTQLSSHAWRGRAAYPLLAAAATLVAVIVTLLVTQSNAGAAVEPVLLGTAGNYAVLGGSAVTKSGPRLISGGELGG